MYGNGVCMFFGGHKNKRMYHTRRVVKAAIEASLRILRK